MNLASPAVEPEGRLPDRFAREGGDRSPPLEWSDLPEQTKALCLVVEDPDAPRGGFTHWLLWNVPATEGGLEEGVPHRGWFADGTRQGDNDFGERGWSGPRPPTTETHRYVFHLYALREPLELTDGARREEVDRALEGVVLDEATLVSTYGG